MSAGGIGSSSFGSMEEKGRMIKTDEDRKTLGFLSVRKHRELGYFGGLLMLNPHGRPLEFHCTLPMKPSRAQEILYGPTLDGFLCGEQIAFALTSKLKEPPCFVFTDTKAVLPLRNLLRSPVMWIQTSMDSSSDFQESSVGEIDSFEVGDYQVSVLQSFASDRDFVLKQWKAMNVRVAIDEPFGRIDEALQEANPSTKVA